MLFNLIIFELFCYSLGNELPDFGKKIGRILEQDLDLPGIDILQQQEQELHKLPDQADQLLHLPTSSAAPPPIDDSSEYLTDEMIEELETAADYGSGWFAKEDDGFVPHPTVGEDEWTMATSESTRQEIWSRPSSSRPATVRRAEDLVVEQFKEVPRLTQAARLQRVNGQRGELQQQRPHQRATEQRVGQTRAEQQGDRKRQRASASSVEEEEGEKFETAETKDKTLKRSILDTNYGGYASTIGYEYGDLEIEPRDFSSYGSAVEVHDVSGYGGGGSGYGGGGSGGGYGAYSGGGGHGGGGYDDSGHKIQPRKPGPFGPPTPNFKCEKSSETLYVTETRWTFDKKCFTIYKVQCNEGYDTGKCEMVYETKVDWEYEQKCTTSYEKECHGYGYHQECEDVPKEHCKQVPKKVEKQVPRTQCKKVPDKRCQDFPINVPRKECKEFPKTVCTQDPVNVPKKIPKKTCIQIPKEICNKVPRQIIEDVPKKVGKKVCTSTKPTSSYGHEASSYSEPLTPTYSAYGSSDDGYSAPVESYSPPANSYSSPSDSYSAPAPSYSPPAPSYSSPAQGYSPPSSSYSSYNQGYKREAKFITAGVAPSDHNLHASQNTEQPSAAS